MNVSQFEKPPMNKLLILTILLSLAYACNPDTGKSNKQVWENEIMKTEKEFSEMARQQGIPKAFLTYSADSAVLMRNNHIIQGKEAIKQHYDKQNVDWSAVILSWKPDFVEVSFSGDLAYTYGKYLYLTRDSAGKQDTASGVFHTVWKRQTDGSWRFVWD